MVSPEKPALRPSPELSSDRVAEARDAVARVAHWAAGRTDVVGLLLVGSYSRGAARPDSDVDLVLLTQDIALYEDGSWTDDLALGDLIRVQAWGAIKEHRFVTHSGLEVEIGLGSRDWARTNPVDPGTRRVVSDGAVPMFDPEDILAHLVGACA